MSQDVLYCSKCRAAMGYRLDVLPEVWRESWRCYVCGSISYKDHPRYDLARKAENAEKESSSDIVDGIEKAKEVAPVLAENGDTPVDSKEPVQTSLLTDSVDSGEEPVKRKRGRPRKISI